MTGQDVMDGKRTEPPPSFSIFVEVRICTDPIPPASVVVGSTVGANQQVVVLIRCAELHPVRHAIALSCCHHGVSGVSAVLGHRQTLLVILIIDGEVSVLCRVPQTVITQDLRITYPIYWTKGVQSINQSINQSIPQSHILQTTTSIEQ